MILKRTGKKMKFTDVRQGNPFFAHGQVWIKTDTEAATVLGNSGEFKSCCNFMIDKCDRTVEVIEFQQPAKENE